MSENPVSTPPSAQRVARRAMVLAAVTCRAFSDHQPENPESQNLQQRLLNWVDSLKLQTEIEASELRLLRAPIATLDQQERIAATWRSEGLAILAWSLGLAPFPAPDQQIDPFEVTDALALLNPEASGIISSSRLRPPDELSSCREVHYSIHCRLSGFHREKAPRDIRDWFDPHWLESLELHNLFDAHGDLRIGGVSLAEIDDSTRNLCESAIRERHRAAMWLVGEGDTTYSRISVDT